MSRCIACVVFLSLLGIQFTMARESGGPCAPDTPFREQMKTELVQAGVFDGNFRDLTRAHAKELDALLDSVEIMTHSRARQPDVAQNSVSRLRALQAALEKQFKDKLVSRSLYEKFQFDKSNATKKTTTDKHAWAWSKLAH